MSDDGGDHQQENGASTPQSPPPQPSTLQTDSIPAKMIEHFKANKIDSAMLGTRLLTIIFAVFYILPIFGNHQSAFNKVLLANAATSALRLHQRLPAFTISREFISRLFVEDSFHYLMFSLIFFNAQPSILILNPIVLFAVLHSSSYSLKLLDLIGQNSWWGARFLISLVEFQANNILKAAAYSEIFIMPLVVILTFMGRVGLMSPFIYYHFLVMRYSSRRNPYTRNAFTELRMATETLAARSPAIVAKVLRGGVACVSHFAPQPQPATQ